MQTHESRKAPHGNAILTPRAEASTCKLSKASHERPTFVHVCLMPKHHELINLRKLRTGAQLLPKRSLCSRHRDPINWRKLRTGTQFLLFSEKTATQLPSADPHRGGAAGSTAPHPRPAGGGLRRTFVPAIFWRKLRTGAPEGPKMATARRRHARSVSALQRVVGVINNR